MRYLVSTSLLLVSLAGQAEPVDPLIKEGLALIPPFQRQLMTTVKTAVKTGGPQQAVLACQELAPQISSEHSQAPWHAGRTALKVRNPENAPDAWERSVLQQFAQRAANGEPLNSMMHTDVVAGEFRLMKAIPTAQACLACHGSSIKPELAALIDQRYPHDQARGFNEGELRGAFTLRRAMQ